MAVDERAVVAVGDGQARVVVVVRWTLGLCLPWAVALDGPAIALQGFDDAVDAVPCLVAVVIATSLAGRRSTVWLRRKGSRTS